MDKLQFILSDLFSKDIDTLALSNKLGINPQKVDGKLKSLQSQNVIEIKKTVSKGWELTEEGKQIEKHGSHEAILYNSIAANGTLQSELKNNKIGFNQAMSTGWIAIGKHNGKQIIYRKVDTIVDEIQIICKKVLAEFPITEQEINRCKKRNLISETKKTLFNIKRGINFDKYFEENFVKAETELTPEMIKTGSWKTKQFKPYNFDALGQRPASGHLHPLLKVRTYFRQIFLEMGFSEMPTNNYVESSFWNFDALFQPQQHPARDTHDTFFISKPPETTDIPLNYLEKIRAVHSKSYKYDWQEYEARKNILRTHTTAVSARILYNLAQQTVFTPVKYFSIDRVFRNETLDATHLAEFHQVEGLVADYNITLGNLMGYIEEFFAKYGLSKIRFKPAYNPYTEPSMEIFAYHEGLKKSIEIGNSGMFRPEVLLPMGLPAGVSVIAWGLSLERPTMIKYGISNIRELFGHKVDLQKIYDNPICRIKS